MENTLDYLSHTIYYSHKNPLFHRITIENTEFANIIIFWFSPESWRCEIDVNIAKSLIIMVIAKDTIHDHFHIMFSFCKANFEIIVARCDWIDIESVTIILIDGLFYKIHGFLELISEFALEHHFWASWLCKIFVGWGSILKWRVCHRGKNCDWLYEIHEISCIFFLFLEKTHECVDYLLKNWVYDTLFKINEIYHV